ncbi:Zinc finger BED domain-containing protein RICESLEEPER 3 [Eumeta japonica]|uniref:Zinc finger BED domain-containing protein RICESLEEPER 3 n=1 Tax=Eumeta variegata TaxID=151549 RepID=A0A4C1Z5F8_EUMVA|nr:Zinc finger BED domain-containing protein RICESLEEPER 3 [Eumeta japonica]
MALHCMRSHSALPELVAFNYGPHIQKPRPRLTVQDLSKNKTKPARLLRLAARTERRFTEGITVDNATANTKFIYELGKQLPHFDSDNQHFRCFAHILNLGVQDLLKILALHCETDTNAQEQQYEDYEDKTEEDEKNAPNIADSRTSVTKLRSISSKIKRSEILKRKLQSAYEVAGVLSNLNPILDCPTRWNSTHDMIGFDLKVRAGINILCGSVTELNDFQITAKSLLKFNELYEEYRSLHSLNKSLESPRNENKVCDEDEDVIDFEKLYECPSTSSGSCLQGLLIDELEEYLRKPRAASSEDILEWWRTHETEYPVLSQMARDFLSIPATSVPAARLFSKASLVIGKQK